MVRTLSLPGVDLEAALRRVKGRGLAWATFGTGVVDVKVRGVPDDSAFEWGSITKTVTGTLLALMVSDGTVQLRTPVSQLLPGAPPVPLEALASHTAGLPRLLPDSLRFTLSVWKDRRDPYASITEARLLADLRRTRLHPGRYRYSNAGMGLLGLALARAAGATYESLVQQHICAPLELSSVTTADNHQLVDGADQRGRAVPHWHFTDALAGAGALRGSIRDLARWAQAVGGCAPEPLASGLEEALRPRVRTRAAEVGLGWHRSTLGGLTGPRAPLPAEAALRWHNGGTGGFRSFVGWDEAQSRGVAVLNAGPKPVDGLAVFLLRETGPHEQP